MNRIFAIVLAVLVACAGCGGDKSKKLEKFLSSGKQYAEQGKFAEAAIQFKNVIQLDPKNAEGHYRLGVVSLKLGKFQEAYRTFAEAVHLDPENRDARVQLANLYLLSRQSEEAAESAKILLEKDEKDWHAWVILGNARLLEKNFEEAEKAFGRALELAPNEMLPRFAQGKYLEMKGALGEAEAEYRKLMDEFPDSLEVEQALIGLLARQGKRESLVEVAKAAAEKSPENMGKKRALAQVYFDQVMLDEAAAVARGVLEKEPKTGWAELLLGRVHLAQGRKEEAAKAFEAAVASEPKSILNRVALADFQINENRVEEAEKVVRSILEDDPGNPEGLVLRGRIDIAKKDLPAAQRRFEEAVQRAPSMAMAHHFLGVTQAMRGNDNLAIQSLKKALELDSRIDMARRALGNLYLESGQPELAEEVLKPLVSGRHFDRPAVLAYAEALRRLKRFEEAHSILDGLLKDHPGDRDLLLAKGRLLLTTGKTEEAVETYRKALAQDPTSQEAVLRIAEVTLAKQGPGEARKWIESRLPDMKEKAVFLNILGKISFLENKLDQAEEYLKKSIEENPNLVDTYVTLSQVYVRKGSQEKALKLYQDLAKKKPDSPSVLMLTGMLFESMGRVEEAMKQYEGALKLDAEFGPAANNLAWLLIERGEDPDRALVLAETARRKMPESPFAADTLGWVYAKKGFHQKAVNLFNEALGQIPNNPTVHYHLGFSLAALGDRDKAKASLEKALSINPKFPEAEEAKKLLADLAH